MKQDTRDCYCYAAGVALGAWTSHGEIIQWWEAVLLFVAIWPLSLYVGRAYDRFRDYAVGRLTRMVKP